MPPSPKYIPSRAPYPGTPIFDLGAGPWVEYYSTHSGASRFQIDPLPPSITDLAMARIWHVPNTPLEKDTSAQDAGISSGGRLERRRVHTLHGYVTVFRTR